MPKVVCDFDWTDTSDEEPMLHRRTRRRLSVSDRSYPGDAAFLGLDHYVPMPLQSAMNNCSIYTSGNAVPLGFRDMLSLKNTAIQFRNGPSKGLNDLPCELIDVILQYIYRSSGDYIPSIFAASRACRHIAASASAMFLKRLVVRADGNVIDKSSWEMLLHLSVRPHSLKHVRCLEFKVAIEARPLPDPVETDSARIGQKLSRKALMQCLPLMTGLRVIKIHCLTDVVFDVLQALQAVQPLQVSVRLDTSVECTAFLKEHRLQQTVASATNWTFAFALPPTRITKLPLDLGNLLDHNAIEAIDWCNNWRTIDAAISQGSKLSALEEVHIPGKLLEVEDRLLTPGLIPWLSLKRLHIEGDRQIQRLLPSVVNQLKRLEDLRLHASTPDIFHPGCLDRNHRRRTPSKALSYVCLPSLKHLSLRGICPHLHVQFLTTPNLQSLCLFIPEYYARINCLKEARLPAEIKWLAVKLPHLEHLELQIGSLENLWHPTAIPGVEVDVEVYAVLQAIGQIRNLKSLRLFPPYVPKNAGHDYLNARQPMSDGQAVRVFHHLHAQRPSLQTLAISATFGTLHGFQPMSWLVHSTGKGKTTLSTRQAGKDYDIEQVWDGERRLWTTNRRHYHRKPYLKDMVGGWVFPVEDPQM